MFQSHQLPTDFRQMSNLCEISRPARYRHTLNMVFPVFFKKNRSCACRLSTIQYLRSHKSRQIISMANQTPPPSYFVVHLSDLHFREDDDVDTEELRNRIPGDLADFLKVKESEGEGKLACIIISGDFYDQGPKSKDGALKSSVNESIRVWMRKLCKETGISTSQVLVCPGNHDLDAEARKGCHNSGRWLYDPVEAHQLIADPSHFKECKCAYSEYLNLMQSCEVAQTADGQSYLYGKYEFDNIRLRIIIANSSWHCCHRPEGDQPHDHGNMLTGHSILRSDTFENSAKENGFFNIGVVHHGSDFLHPLDKYPFSPYHGGYYLLKKDAHLILSGHEHPDNPYANKNNRNIDDEYFEAYEFTSGALFFNLPSPDAKTKEYEVRNPFFQVFSINRSNNKIKHYYIKYPYDDKSKWPIIDDPKKGAKAKTGLIIPEKKSIGRARTITTVNRLNTKELISDAKHYHDYALENTCRPFEEVGLYDKTTLRNREQEKSIRFDYFDSAVQFSYIGSGEPQNGIRACHIEIMPINVIENFDQISFSKAWRPVVERLKQFNNKHVLPFGAKRKDTTIVIVTYDVFYERITGIQDEKIVKEYTKYQTNMLNKFRETLLLYRITIPVDVNILYSPGIGMARGYPDQDKHGPFP